MKRVGAAWTNEFVGKRVGSVIAYRVPFRASYTPFCLSIDRFVIGRRSIENSFRRLVARRKRSPAGNYEFDGRDGASYFLSRTTLKITTADAIYSSQTGDRGSCDDTRNSVWTDRRSGVERPRPGKIDSSYAWFRANSCETSSRFENGEGNGRGTEGRGLWRGEGKWKV